MYVLESKDITLWKQEAIQFLKENRQRINTLWITMGGKISEEGMDKIENVEDLELMSTILNKDDQYIKLYQEIKEIKNCDILTIKLSSPDKFRGIISEETPYQSIMKWVENLILAQKRTLVTINSGFGAAAAWQDLDVRWHFNEEYIEKLGTYEEFHENVERSLNFDAIFHVLSSLRDPENQLENMIRYKLEFAEYLTGLYHLYIDQNIHSNFVRPSPKEGNDKPIFICDWKNDLVSETIRKVQPLTGLQRPVKIAPESRKVILELKKVVEQEIKIQQLSEVLEKEEPKPTDKVVSEHRYLPIKPLRLSECIFTDITNHSDDHSLTQEITLLEPFLDEEEIKDITATFTELVGKLTRSRIRSGLNHIQKKETTYIFNHVIKQIKAVKKGFLRNARIPRGEMGRVHRTSESDSGNTNPKRTQRLSTRPVQTTSNNPTQPGEILHQDNRSLEPSSDKKDRPKTRKEDAITGYERLDDLNHMQSKQPRPRLVGERRDIPNGNRSDEKDHNNHHTSRRKKTDKYTLDKLEPVWIRSHNAKRRNFHLSGGERRVDNTTEEPAKSQYLSGGKSNPLEIRAPIKNRLAVEQVPSAHKCNTIGPYRKKLSSHDKISSSGKGNPLRLKLRGVEIGKGRIRQTLDTVGKRYLIKKGNRWKRSPKLMWIKKYERKGLLSCEKPLSPEKELNKKELLRPQRMEP